MRHTIEVAQIEFHEGGNTMWIHSPLGATTIRIKTNGKITTERCGNSPVSHCDLIVDDDISFCLSEDSVTNEIDAPKWDDAGKVHDWRNYITDEIRGMWNTFSQSQREAIQRSAEQSSDKEEWD